MSSFWCAERQSTHGFWALTTCIQQSGTEFARTKEDQAAIMRAKQAAGTPFSPFLPFPPSGSFSSLHGPSWSISMTLTAEIHGIANACSTTAEAKKAAANGTAKK